MGVIQINRRNIEKVANQILDKTECKEVPVPIKNIAEKLGIEIREEPYNGKSEDLSGVLIRNTNKTIIGVNWEHPDTRKRFTIAHEIGHFILHEGNQIFIDKNFRVNYRNNTSSKATSIEEIEANAFAAAILMPEKDLRNIVMDRVSEGIDIEDSKEIKKLAKEFGVSQQALLIRLVKLGLIENDLF